MEGSEELSILAEVLATLAGFTSMVVAIRGRGNPHPWDSYRAVTLLVTCLGGLIIALFPFALHTFDVTGPALWRLSSAAAFLVTRNPMDVPQGTLKVPMAQQTLPLVREKMSRDDNARSLLRAL